MPKAILQAINKKEKKRRMQNLRDKQRRKRSCSNTRRNFHMHLDQNHRARKKRAPSRALYPGKRKQTLLHSCFVILNSHRCNITETWSKRLLRKRRDALPAVFSFSSLFSLFLFRKARRPGSSTLRVQNR